MRMSWGSRRVHVCKSRGHTAEESNLASALILDLASVHIVWANSLTKISLFLSKSINYLSTYRSVYHLAIINPITIMLIDWSISPSTYHHFDQIINSHVRIQTSCWLHRLNDTYFSCTWAAAEVINMTSNHGGLIFQRFLCFCSPVNRSPTAREKTSIQSLSWGRRVSEPVPMLQQDVGSLSRSSSRKLSWWYSHIIQTSHKNPKATDLASHSWGRKCQDGSTVLAFTGLSCDKVSEPREMDRIYSCLCLCLSLLCSFLKMLIWANIFNPHQRKSIPLPKITLVGV